MIALPEPGYLARMRVYFAEMYPLPSRLLLAALTYVGIAAFVRRTAEVSVSLASLHTALGIWNVFCLLLILRLMDELKDKDDDRVLFRHRPLPSGRVLEADISGTLAFLLVLFLAANAWTGPAFAVALLVVGYALLMFRYFFIPHVLRAHPLLNLATHNPIAPLLLFHCFALASTSNGLPLAALDWRLVAPYIVMAWAASLGWEFSRKIRCAEREDGYMTYSRLFGRPGAVVAAGAAQTAAYGLGLYLYAALSLSPGYLAILSAGYAATIWGHARFLGNPTPRRSHLRAFAEAYMVAVLAAQVSEFTGLARGLW